MIITASGNPDTGQTDADQTFMREALIEAGKAADTGEIPVGCIIVWKNEIVARAHNLTGVNPLWHAEALAIAEVLGNEKKFLYEYTLFVTLEPCIMCAGQIILSRVGRVVYGATDPRAGAVGSVYHVLYDKSFNHRPIVKSGVLAEESASLLRKYFSDRRHS